MAVDLPPGSAKRWKDPKGAEPGGPVTLAELILEDGPETTQGAINEALRAVRLAGHIWARPISAIRMREVETLAERLVDEACTKAARDARLCVE